MNLRKQTLKQLLLVISFPVLLGANILTGSFQFDDTLFTRENTLGDTMRDSGTLLKWFLSGGYSQRAVVWTSLWANYRFGQINPFGYHLFNILIHALNGVTLFFVCRGLIGIVPGRSAGRQPLSRGLALLFPLISSLIFLSLPIQTETVAYISSRSSSLVTLFYLMAVLFFIRTLALKGERLFSGRTLPLMAGLIVCILLGRMTKMSIVSIPLVLFTVYYYRAGSPLLVLIRKFRFFLTVISIIVVSVICVRAMEFHKEYTTKPAYKSSLEMELKKGYVDSRFEHMMKRGVYDVLGIHTGYEPGLYSPIDYLMTEVDVVMTYYLGKLLFPFEMNVNPDVPLVRQFRLSTVAGIAAFIIILICSFRVAAPYPIIPLSVLWFFLAIAPSSSLVPLFDLASEHRIYIASPAFSIFFGFLLSLLLLNKSSGPGHQVKTLLCMAMITCFAATFILRNACWRTEFALWSDSARKSPYSSRSHHNLGLALFNDKLYSRAILEYNKAYKLRPSPGTLINLSETYKKLKLFKEAIRYLNQAVKVESYDLHLAYYNLGVLYQEMGEFRKAIESYEAPRALLGENPEALNNLGEIYMALNQTAKAKAYFEKALEFRPLHHESLNNLGSLYQGTGDLKTAEYYYRKAITSKPYMPQAYINLGSLYLMQGKLEEAEANLRAAISIDPLQEPAYANLGDLLCARKLYGRAVEAYNAALKIKPDNAIIHRNLGTIYYNHLQDDKKALYHYKRTITLWPDQDYADAIRKIISELSN